MCGIAGASFRDAPRTPFDVLAARFAEALAHRGPDGHGSSVHGRTLLVHTRLAIIDPAGGAQPLADADGRACLIANGEIYNYKALRRQLAAEGARFATGSDAESALHCYLKHGEGFLKHLRGMYAIAVHDRARDELLLARDPFGIKPLYYLERDWGVAFASELPAFTAAGLLTPRADPALVPGFLRDQFVPGAQTLLADVRRVLPGECLRIRDGRIVARHRLLPKLPPVTTRSPAVATAEFDTLFRQVVADHLQADVPYGLFLSGGIDSGALAVAMRALAGPIRTYTVAVRGGGSDDAPRAAALAAALGTEHHEIPFDESDFWRLLPGACAAVDDPTADYAILPMLKLAERAARDVKVVLCGEGGDEVFAGYRRYRDPFWKRWLRRDRRARRGMAAAGLGLPPPAMRRQWTALQRVQADDLFGWLPADLLTKLDRTLMHHGIEGRVPFLDERCAAFGFALDDGLKIRNGFGKCLLRDWFGRHQQAVSAWERKQGFTVPIRLWLEARRDLLDAFLGAHEGLRTLVPAPILAAARAARPLDTHTAQLNYRLLCFALWYEAVVLGRTPTAALFAPSGAAAAMQPALA